MRCPFLREEQVKACQASPFRKQLARTASQHDDRCTSPEHRSCPAAPQYREANPDPSRCPFLRESLVQYCAAVPHAPHVPWSETSLSRCGNDGHRFCEQYLAMAGGIGRGPAHRSPQTSEEDLRVAEIDGIPVPGWLLYAPNHLWLDEGDEGLCHLGIDGFLAQVLGGVERVAFLTPRGRALPTVVLTAAGEDLTLQFPRELQVVETNTRLRSALHKLSADPYGRGWLFEVRRTEPSKTDSPSQAPLLRGDEARQWMHEEVRRLAEFAHDHLLHSTSSTSSASRPADARPVMADGGAAVPDLLHHLDHEQVRTLFASFFPTTRDSGEVV